MNQILTGHKAIFFLNEGDQLSVFIGKDGELGQKISDPSSFTSDESFGFFSLMQSEQFNIFHLKDSSAISALDGSIKEIMEVVEGEQMSAGQGAILCRALGLLWGRFQGQTKHIALPRIFAKNIQLNEGHDTTFYGGSFYPWHEGHSECLRLCPKKDIIVVPDSNPWKGRDQQQRELYWERLKEIAHILEDTPHAVYPGFWGMPSGNPTVDWLPAFLGEKKNLLVGADTFLGLHKWTRVEQLLEIVSEIYVVPRLVSFDLIDEQKENLKTNFSHLSIQTLSPHPYEHLSSTLLRGGK